jgi:hypothetical protein
MRRTFFLFATLALLENNVASAADDVDELLDEVEEPKEKKIKIKREMDGSTSESTQPRLPSLASPMPPPALNIHKLTAPAPLAPRPYQTNKERPIPGLTWRRARSSGWQPRTMT